MAPENCASCKFWDKRAENPVTERGLGFCRRYPPIPQLQFEAEFETVDVARKRDEFGPAIFAAMAADLRSGNVLGDSSKLSGALEQAAVNRADLRAKGWLTQDEGKWPRTWSDEWCGEWSATESR